jgi:hypothetical protein
MHRSYKLSAITIAATFVLGPLACLADSEAALQASSESKDASQQGSFAATQNSASAQNRPSSEAEHSSQSNSTVEAGRPRNVNEANLDAGQRSLQAQADARKQAAASHVPSNKVARYNWNHRSKQANRSYMVNTIQQAARTK